MEWVGHVACMGEGTGIYRVLVGKPAGNVGDPGIDRRTLRRIFRK